MDIKSKIKNINNLNKKDSIDMIHFYLDLVQRAFEDAEQCKTCTESCCDIYNNNLKKIKELLKNLEEKNIEKKKDIKPLDVNKNNEIGKDYIASIEINNFEKKYIK